MKWDSFTPLVKLILNVCPRHIWLQISSLRAYKNGEFLKMVYICDWPIDPLYLLRFKWTNG